MSNYKLIRLQVRSLVGPVGHGSPAAPRRLWVRFLVGTNFCLRVKKPHRLPHVQSTVEPGLTQKATAPVYGWGRGSGVFLVCCEKVILPLKQCRGGGLTPRRSSFFLAVVHTAPAALVALHVGLPWTLVVKLMPSCRRRCYLTGLNSICLRPST